MNETDHQWMDHALDLAERGRGHVEPNPLVGAVVVRDAKVVGEGWHHKYGLAHAEVEALEKAGEAARGAVLYVTLEPCCHQGKTPPCTEAIRRAGIARVVAAMIDPFPDVSGKGIGLLEAAGLVCEVGVCEATARRLNAPYLKLLATGLPYVHAKWAMTLDGKIATRTGDSKWISNEAARRAVHGLRGLMDAILVGIGTALTDDPLLTPRPPGPRLPVRVVLDSHGRLPARGLLAKTAKDIPVLVATNSKIAAERVRTLEEWGCEVLPLPSAATGVSVNALLRELGKRRMTNVLVEGGARILGSFFDARALDEFHVFIAPRLVGGPGAAPVAGHGLDRIADSLNLDHCELQEMAGNFYIHGWRNPQ